MLLSRVRDYMGEIELFIWRQNRVDPLFVRVESGQRESNSHFSLVYRRMMPNDSESDPADWWKSEEPK